MSLSLHESRRRSRRQRRSRTTAGFLIFAVLVALGYAAYSMGGYLAERHAERLQGEIDRLTQNIAALDERNTALQSTVQEATSAQNFWKQQYERDLPSGPAKTLLALIRTRLAEGVQPSRLELAIGAVVNEPACDDKPVTKRFIVRTPLHPGGNDTVSFADNTITVTAEGKPTVDSNGNGRAIFDPAQPVKLSFALLGGHKMEATGVLPIHHSVLTDKAEYRFTVVASDNLGFVNVTGDRCQAPG